MLNLRYYNMHVLSSQPCLRLGTSLGRKPPPKSCFSPTVPLLSPRDPFCGWIPNTERLAPSQSEDYLLKDPPGFPVAKTPHLGQCTDLHLAHWKSNALWRCSSWASRRQRKAYKVGNLGSKRYTQRIPLSNGGWERICMFLPDGILGNPRPAWGCLTPFLRLPG